MRHGLTGQRLGDLAHGRDNNFNLIRFLAASLVILSHAYSLALGPGAEEPLHFLLKGDDLGRLCVFTFFAISGFFIAASFERKKSLGDFVKARVLRIWPGLFVMLATMLPLTLALTDHSWRGVDLAWREAVDNLLMFTGFVAEAPAPAEFFSGNPVAGPFNGSLWTLRHEVLAYILVAVLGSLGLLQRPRLALAGLFLAICAYYVMPRLTGRIIPVTFSYVGLPFFFGATFYIWRDKVILHGGIVLALLALAALLWPTPLFFPALIALLAYGVLWLGYAPSGRLREFNRLGDYSYGIYIYAFPIQQMLAWSGWRDPLPQAGMAFLLSLGCAVLSWHFVEEPAMRLRRRRALALSR